MASLAIFPFTFTIYGMGYKVLDLSTWGGEAAVLFSSNGHFFVSEFNLTKYGISPLKLNFSARSVAVYGGKLYVAHGNEVSELSGETWKFPSQVISVRPSNYGVLVLTEEGLYSLSGREMLKVENATSLFPIGWKVFVVTEKEVISWDNGTVEEYHVQGVRYVCPYHGKIAFVEEYKIVSSGGELLAKSMFPLYSCYQGIVGGKNFVGYVKGGEVVKAKGSYVPGEVKWMFPIGNYLLIGSDEGYLAAYNPKVGVSFQLSLGLLSFGGFDGTYTGICFYRGIAVITGYAAVPGESGSPELVIAKYDGAFMGFSTIPEAKSQINCPIVYQDKLLLLTAKGKVIEYNGMYSKVVWQDPNYYPLYCAAIYGNRLYIGGIGGTFVEYNGKEFKELSYFSSQKPNIFGMASSSSGLWIVGSEGLIARYSGGRMYFYNVSPAAVLTSVAISDNGSVAVGAQHGTVYFWEGKEFRPVSLPTTKNVVSVSWMNNTLYAFGEGFIATLKEIGGKYEIRYYRMPFSLTVWRTTKYQGKIFGVGSNGVIFAIGRGPVNVEGIIERVSNVPTWPYRFLTVIFIAVLIVSAISVYFLTKRWYKKMGK